MKDKTQYEALMEELQKIVENFRAGVTEIGERFAKLLPNIEIYEEEEEDTWEMKCPYKDGDEYYFIYDNVVDWEYWEDTILDTERFDAGNVFPTEEVALIEVKRRNLLTRFRAFRDECNGDWKADWNDVTHRKYYVFYSETKNDVCVTYIVFDKRFHTFGYFKNGDDAYKAIDLFGDEIKELFVECD
jgi:hypothetical protein